MKNDFNLKNLLQENSKITDNVITSKPTLLRILDINNSEYSLKNNSIGFLNINSNQRQEKNLRHSLSNKTNNFNLKESGIKTLIESQDNLNIEGIRNNNPIILTPKKSFSDEFEKNLNEEIKDSNRKFHAQININNIEAKQTKFNEVATLKKYNSNKFDLSSKIKNINTKHSSYINNFTKDTNYNSPIYPHYNNSNNKAPFHNQNLVNTSYENDYNTKSLSLRDSLDSLTIKEKRVNKEELKADSNFNRTYSNKPINNIDFQNKILFNYWNLTNNDYYNNFNKGTHKSENNISKNLHNLPDNSSLSSYTHKETLWRFNTKEVENLNFFIKEEDQDDDIEKMIYNNIMQNTKNSKYKVNKTDHPEKKEINLTKLNNNITDNDDAVGLNSNINNIKIQDDKNNNDLDNIENDSDNTIMESYEVSGTPKISNQNINEFFDYDSPKSENINNYISKVILKEKNDDKINIYCNSSNSFNLLNKNNNNHHHSNFEFMAVTSKCDQNSLNPIMKIDDEITISNYDNSFNNLNKNNQVDFNKLDSSRGIPAIINDKGLENPDLKYLVHSNSRKDNNIINNPYKIDNDWKKEKEDFELPRRNESLTQSIDIGNLDSQRKNINSLKELTQTKNISITNNLKISGIFDRIGPNSLKVEPFKSQEETNSIVDTTTVNFEKNSNTNTENKLFNLGLSNINQINLGLQNSNLTILTNQKNINNNSTLGNHFLSKEKHSNKDELTRIDVESKNNSINMCDSGNTKTSEIRKFNLKSLAKTINNTKYENKRLESLSVNKHFSKAKKFVYEKDKPQSFIHNKNHITNSEGETFDSLKSKENNILEQGESLNKGNLNNNNNFAANKNVIGTNGFTFNFDKSIFDKYKISAAQNRSKDYFLSNISINNTSNNNLSEKSSFRQQNSTINKIMETDMETQFEKNKECIPSGKLNYTIKNSSKNILITQNSTVKIDHINNQELEKINNNNENTIIDLNTIMQEEQQVFFNLNFTKDKKYLLSCKRCAIIIGTEGKNILKISF